MGKCGKYDFFYDTDKTKEYYIKIHPIQDKYEIDIAADISVPDDYPKIWKFKSKINLYIQVACHELGHLFYIPLNELGTRDRYLSDENNRKINSWLLDMLMPNWESVQQNNTIVFEPEI